MMSVVRALVAQRSVAITAERASVQNAWIKGVALDDAQKHAFR